MWGPAPPVSRLDVVFEGCLEAAATFVMVPQGAAELLYSAGAELRLRRCRKLDFKMLVLSWKRLFPLSSVGPSFELEEDHLQTSQINDRSLELSEEGG